MNIPSYDQPEKQRARSLVLERAVAAVTSDRHSSPLVRADEFQETLDFSLYVLRQYGFNGELAAEVRAYAREWHTFFNCTLGQKSASDVRVLYLCGPEPHNDLDVLLRLGIMQQNIWAIESEQGEYRKAVEQLAQSESFIRIHHGNLEEFFEIVNERFDIVYIDACGPLPGGKPNTLRGPLLMFHRERLAPLGVLITNFSRPNNEREEEFKRLISCFFHARSRDLPRVVETDGADPAIAQYDPSYLWPYLRRHFAESYSDFVTRLLVDLGREIVPLARIYDNSSLRRKYFSPDQTLKAALDRALLDPSEVQLTGPPENVIRDFLFSVGDVHLNATGYPVLNFLRRARTEKTLAPIMQNLLGYKLKSSELWQSYQSSAILASIIEGHWEAASKELRAALRSPWLDSRHPIFCDLPLPHLLINSLFGIYGHPYFVNPAASVRLSYVAKKTEMYLDALVLDQCRYYFDFLPTIDLIPQRLDSWAYQLVLRACLDRIGRHDFSSSSHPFHGAALGGFGEFTCAVAYDFEVRAFNNGKAFSTEVEG